jgi:hypothetical protein
MSNRYVVVLESGSSLPEREFLVSQAWGSVPVSYVQDEEAFNECSFLDLKVNKWEVNSEWSNKQDSEPWIRIEKFKGDALEELLQKEGCRWASEMAGKTLMVIELDDGGTKLDYFLLLRLVSVFYGQFKVYRWSDSIEELSGKTIESLPAQHTVREWLIRCE